MKLWRLEADEAKRRLEADEALEEESSVERWKPK